MIEVFAILIFFLFFCQCDCIHLLEKWNIKRVNIDKDEV